MHFPIRLVQLLLGVLVAVSLGGCRSGETPAATDSPAVPPAQRLTPVVVEAVELGDVPRTVGASTTLRSAVELNVVAEIAGTLREVLAESGDRVERGQLLARIENDDIRLSLREAEAARTRANLEVERLRPLHESGYLARQVFDQAVFEAQNAGMAVDRLRSQGASQRVTAPRAGVVLSRRAEQGEVVMPNQALFVIADTDELEARIALPERELPGLALEQPAELVVEAMNNARVRGHVSHIDPGVDARSGTIEVRVRLEGVETPAGRLRPGMFAAVQVVTDVHLGVPTIPKRAIVREGGVDVVFAVIEEPQVAEGSGDAASGYAVRRAEVELGYETRDRVEVTRGLSVGERVVVVGQGGLDESARVVIPADDEATQGADD